MGIEIVNGITPQSNTGKPLPEPSNRLGKDDFLQLLVTQLRYQDPTNPMSNEEFIAQTAQFSALEQMQDVNTNIKSLIELQKTSARTEALSLIGKQVTAESASFNLTAGSSATLDYSISKEGNVSINILDANQNVVRRLFPGEQAVGNHSFVWDGKDGNGASVPNGSYSYEVLAQDADGEEINTNEMISGIVDGVAVENDQIYVSIGGSSFTLSSVTKIQ